MFFCVCMHACPMPSRKHTLAQRLTSKIGIVSLPPSQEETKTITADILPTLPCQIWNTKTTDVEKPWVSTLISLLPNLAILSKRRHQKILALTQLCFLQFPPFPTRCKLWRGPGITVSHCQHVQ